MNLSQRLANLSPKQRAALQARLQSQSAPPEPIAVVGMSCRFPGAPNLDAYWELISGGIDGTSDIPLDRFDIDALYDPSGQTAGKMSVRRAGLVSGIDQFDPQFFGISPREAARMDPQQRLLLEVAWESLEIGGIDARQIADTDASMFVGIGGTDYSKLPSQYNGYYKYIDAHVGTGNALSIAANRVSYIMDLHGPSMAIDTACSSSTMATHLAVQSLRRGECSLAIAGGVNAILTPETTIAFSKAQMLSPDGCCRPFDQAANGYVRGEGCGLVVLKRLTDAVAADDLIFGVIRATATNQDGRTSGITAPNGLSQQAVIRSALKQAGITPSRVDYIEAHGTGTPLGDPIEVDALTKVFGPKQTDDKPLYVTSVKANVGHMETVSGVAGMIKVMLMMRHRHIAPQLHLKSLNDKIKLGGSRIVIPDRSPPWPANDDRPLVAGVSSFGFGGSNTHVILEAPANASVTPAE
ncbi:MAG: polyketide synthase, partial [Planctomycetota bacterium]